MRNIFLFSSSQLLVIHFSLLIKASFNSPFFLNERRKEIMPPKRQHFCQNVFFGGHTEKEGGECKSKNFCSNSHWQTVTLLMSKHWLSSRLILCHWVFCCCRWFRGARALICSVFVLKAEASIKLVIWLIWVCLESGWYIT